MSACTSGISRRHKNVRTDYVLSAVLYEFMIRFVAPLCTYMPHAIEPVPIASVTTIIDLGGLSLKQMWSLRSHLQEASELANQNYPETLGVTVVVNAPSFFSTVWGWIKVSTSLDMQRTYFLSWWAQGWFDENTREKIHVYGDVKDPKSEGSRLIREVIAPENLPKDYGGELDWSFFDPPKLDEQTSAVICEMPRGPWIFKNGKVLRPQEYEGNDQTYDSQAKVLAQPNGAPVETQADVKVQGENAMKQNLVTVG